MGVGGELFDAGPYNVIGGIIRLRWPGESRSAVQETSFMAAKPRPKHQSNCRFMTDATR